MKTKKQINDKIYKRIVTIKKHINKEYEEYKIIVQRIDNITPNKKDWCDKKLLDIMAHDCELKTLSWILLG